MSINTGHTIPYIRMRCSEGGEMSAFGIIRGGIKTEEFDYQALLQTLQNYKKPRDAITRFLLLMKAPNFEMKTYHQSVARELQSLGFEVIVEEKKKTIESTVQSAFIKANTREHFLRIGLSAEDQKRTHSNKVLKVKFEVDTDPPLKFNVNYRPLTFPGPFSIATMTLPDLFAGKMHALLFREYKGWVKGRDSD